MTEGHRRHLASTIRYMGRLIDEAQSVLRIDAAPSPFGSVENDLSDRSRDAVAVALEDLRRELWRVCTEFGLEQRGHPLSAARAVRSHLSVMSIAVDEMRPRSLRGYGDLDAGTVGTLDRACDHLDQLVTRTRGALDRAAPR